ncbi:hypothetical protein PVAP13_1KG111619 [Panicum virgatum]|uniref:Uncharacterized protein n=1 Tax=Panicum virgatum TaxID=38727 RepID=A0A8T0Y3A6_PANVG|nr:hypothetical protein PVAP13_1KG111619 [Panicum virgatum]
MNSRKSKFFATATAIAPHLCHALQSRSRLASHRQSHTHPACFSLATRRRAASPAVGLLRRVEIPTVPPPAARVRPFRCCGRKLRSAGAAVPARCAGSPIPLPWTQRSAGGAVLCGWLPRVRGVALHRPQTAEAPPVIPSPWLQLQLIEDGTNYFVICSILLQAQLHK